MDNDIRENSASRDEVAAACAAATAPSPGAQCAADRPRYFYAFFKRAFDIVSSGLALLLLSWLIFICIFVKWLEDAKNSAYELVIDEVTDPSVPKAPRAKRLTAADGRVYDCLLKPRRREKGERREGPVYASLRVGRNGEFRFYKIRSMCPGAEKMKKQLLEAGLNEADPPAFKIKDDPRITRVGRFLRKTSLDELPQLWNVFKGDMSVVGPRPPLPDEVAQYTPEQRARLSVKGGLLCLWQIQPNRNKLSFDDWIRLDLEYIQKRSFLMDLKIIFKGAYMVLFDRSGE